MNIDDIAQIYDRFIEILEEFSLTPYEQIEKLHGTVVADELATDFSEIGMVYAKLLKDNQWLTEEQYKLMESIDNTLNEMSKQKSFWSNKALVNSNEWASCRKKCEKLLKQFKS